MVNNKNNGTKEGSVLNKVVDAITRWQVVACFTLCFKTVMNGKGIKLSQWSLKFFEDSHAIMAAFYTDELLQGAAEKSGPLIFSPFSQQPSTSNSQIKCDSVEKRRSYRFFNMTAYRFFGIQKWSCYNSNFITSLKQHSQIMIKCQNSIATANVWSVHHQHQLQATTQASSHLV